MDYHELKKLGSDLDAAADSRDIAQIRKVLGRFVSHLQSEQSTSMEHGNLLHEHELKLKLHHKTLFGDEEDVEKKPGMVSDLREIKALLRTVSKVVYIGACALIGLAVKAGWELLRLVPN